MTSAVAEVESLEPPVAAKPRAAAPSRASKKTFAVLLAIGAAAGLAGTAWYLVHKGTETTDDAQIDAEVVAVPSRTSGVVTKVFFAENQPVKAGDVLAELDAEPAKARLAQADANLSAAKASAEGADADARVTETNARGSKSVAEASLQGAASSANATRDEIAEGDAQVASATATFTRASTDLQRVKQLVASGAIAQAELERSEAAHAIASAALAQARAHSAVLKSSTSQAWSKVQEANARLRQSSDVDAIIAQAHARARMAHAQVATLEAARDLAAQDLSYARIVAPQDGVVSRKTISVGQMVAAGQSVVQLIPLQRVWVTGNFKETQLAKMHAGQAAHITVDAYPGVKLTGEVDSFSGATGARFALLPPDNATGNYTKVVQRVPVRVRLKDLPEDLVLRPGMSVDVSIDTSR